MVTDIRRGFVCVLMFSVYLLMRNILILSLISGREYVLECFVLNNGDMQIFQTEMIYFL